MPEHFLHLLDCDIKVTRVHMVLEPIFFPRPRCFRVKDFSLLDMFVEELAPCGGFVTLSMCSTYPNRSTNPLL